MKDDIKSKLDAAFEKHEASKRSAAEAKQVAETKEQIFSREFIQARDTIIRPAMEEIGGYVKGKGYSYEISTEDDKPSPDGRSRSVPASVRLTIFLGERRYQVHENPGFSVICEKGQQKVRFHECTMSPGRGGHAGPAGEATLSQVTKDLIQEKILKVVAEVFR
ncbi:hypothetical protein [Bradyrhizobium liaoningense]|uniref:hypothetical protein n=1 Tax=Bradyrhizobium liaoningense TaxID=43992 RepID=UPI001BA69BF5|nr:hypothetical protein [Bradyrhizobium liaoningense]MBR0945949.1 hypothetical protein [Bradyrhizobium liaoningense]